jgi:hypothetical protein
MAAWQPFGLLAHVQPCELASLGTAHDDSQAPGAAHLYMTLRSAMKTGRPAMRLVMPAQRRLVLCKRPASAFFELTIQGQPRIDAHQARARCAEDAHP